MGAGRSNGTEHHLQHERRSNGGIDRGVRAHEEQREPFVGDRHVRLLRTLLERQPDRLGGARLDGAVPRAIGRSVARGREQPALGLRRHAIDRPPLERRRERVCERVLGRGEIACSYGQPREQPAVRVARDALDLRVAVHVGGAAIGRISRRPRRAAGQRDPQRIAASRSSTSMTKKPPSCSLVSAKGPSCTSGRPSG